MIEARMLIFEDSDLCKDSKYKDFSDIRLKDFYIDSDFIIEASDYIVYRSVKGCKPLKQRFGKVITEWQTV